LSSLTLLEQMSLTFHLRS